jgi:ElaA protein
MPEITTKWQRFETLTAAELYELLRFRQDIFVVEQKSPYSDLDGFDQSALHLSAWIAGALAGYLRLIPLTGPPALVRIGRIAVAARLRRRGLGGTLLTESLHFCRERYPSWPIVLSAQFHLVAFYEGFGFMVASEPYEEFGIRHVDMLRS